MVVDDALIDRILEGGASEEEAANLQAWLQVSENFERFALRAQLHSDLRRALTRRHIQKSAMELSTDGSAKRTVTSGTQLVLPKYGSQQSWTLVLTGLVTAACIFIAFAWWQGDSDAAPVDEFAASVVSNVTGMLTRSGLQWNDTQIPVGDYELQQGLLHLQFGGGVMVYVESPARFDAVSDRRILLHSGRLSARVPPEGIGFTVETPEAEVIDFGTEFSVDVEAGASEVHVFDGLVRVQRDQPNRAGASSSLDLHASQAVRIREGKSELEDITIARDRFIRNFDEVAWNYAPAVRKKAPLVFYRMPIRDRGLASEPPEYSGVLLTGDGKRPPHARGVFIGGSLRVGVDSIGRGGRVDTPPLLHTGRFSLGLFLYRETEVGDVTAITNMHHDQGNFDLSLDKAGKLRATIRIRDGSKSVLVGQSVLPLNQWRYVVLTVDGKNIRLYEDGEQVVAERGGEMATSGSDPIWFGTDANSARVWDGRIDEVTLFDRALSEEEIFEMYRLAQEEIGRTK